jgi:hypothetical protein
MFAGDRAGGLFRHGVVQSHQAGPARRRIVAEARRFTLGGLHRARELGPRRAPQVDRHEEIEQIGDPARVSPAPLLDAAETVLGGVRVNVKSFRGRAQVQIRGGERL